MLMDLQTIDTCRTESKWRTITRMTFDDIRDDEDVLSSSWSGIIELFLVVVASILHAAFFHNDVVVAASTYKKRGRR
jgi:hypothetical protein